MGKLVVGDESVHPSAPDAGDTVVYPHADEGLLFVMGADGKPNIVGQFVTPSVPTGATRTISDGMQWIVAGNVDIVGDLVIEGELHVI